ncbi:outer membrane lipid asymmetry maintenance protein MlaD [Albimonas pacifica]|uniref:Phospholipid/cholesterol/gamma-HCH transport system substrate-binding protein n=1 Tax=Albimonas pacifica TaxID=1114924 RepID=A0A1I3NQ78_9RHOB|nr:outer membrane lipid asymmetry maintenance protein MlaD [Albimonas pacifica]SFJ11100.1 phospholipid/cholesterol/gamma-HCH transport system substrate-binding protein [Albimonas pacifica]
MASSAAETLIGAAVIAVAAGFLVYGAQTADLGPGGSDRYELKAAFRKVEGVSVGADVKIAGVKVGSVSSLELDPSTYQAVAMLSIDGSVKLPDDSDAAIQSEGLLGGNYVAITPGGSDLMLAPGEEILYTQGSVNLMDLVGRAISSAGASD